MYIPPDSEVYLLSGVPLDATYQHTLYFESKEAQEAYFKSKVNINHATPSGELKPYHFTEMTYIRIQKIQEGKVYVEMLPHSSDDMMTLNYLMFKNDTFQHKWFYCFITNILWVNNRTYEVSFEIDYMQTYMFNYSLKECYVEREHVADDTIGKHTLPEPVDLGSYITTHSFGTDMFSNYSVMIGYIQAEGSGSVSADYISGQFSGVMYNIMPCNSKAEAVSIGSFLAGFTEDGTMDNVVCILYVPTSFVSTGGTVIKDLDNTAPERGNTLDGYTPRNNKLLTYPYIGLHVTNGDGEETVLQFEYFSYDPPRFKLIGATSPTPQVLCIPTGYKGERLALDDKIAISEFPQCAYAIDTYRSWLAMNSGQQQINMLRSIGAGIAGGSGATIGLGAWQAMVDSSRAAIMSDRVKGTQTGNAMIGSRQTDFYFQRVTIRKEYAQIIDDFFDRYGYQVNRNKVPATHNRQNWNYVKTRNCTIIGTLPKNVGQKICDIYNNGITFWKNPANVGDYSVSNSPV